MENEEPRLPVVRCIAWLDAVYAWDRFYCFFAFRAIGKLSWNGMICGTTKRRARGNEMRISFQCIRFHYAGVDNDSLLRSKSVDSGQPHVVNSTHFLSRR